MTIQQAQQEIQRLRIDIAHHNRLYYTDAKPIISDQEYDHLYATLNQLEQQFPELLTADSPTQRVGEQPSRHFVSRMHTVPMLSLDNSYNQTNLVEFYTKLQQKLNVTTLMCVVEPKIDGLSISIRYENGILVRALTRGDGFVGDDVTENVRTIQTVPAQLRTDNIPAMVEIRGEVYISSEDFITLNATRQAAGECPFDNARNAAVGSLKLHNPALVAKRPLSAIFYGIAETVGLTVHTQVDILLALQRFGLAIPDPYLCILNADELCQALHTIETLRSSLPYQIDGAVIKVNNLSQRIQLGYTNKVPLWAKAFKYRPEEHETVLQDITVQVSNAGVLTPVGELVPVAFSGVTISRVNLYNEDRIRDLDLRLGDTVVIARAGDAIPVITSVNLQTRQIGSKPFDFAEHLNHRCPSCQQPIVRNVKGATWRCTNVACPMQRVRQLIHLTSHNALNIQPFGMAIAERLVASGLVKHPLDVFSLTSDVLTGLNLGTDAQPRWFGQKNAQTLTTAIQNAKEMSLDHWLYALGIPSLGYVKAREIAKHYRNLTEVINALEVQRPEVLKLHGISSNVSRNMLGFFTSENGKDARQRLLALRIDVLS